MCSWFVLLQFTAQVLLEASFGTVPALSTHVFPSLFLDVEIHRAKQHVQCLTAEGFLSTLNKYLWPGPKSHSTSAS